MKKIFAMAAALIASASMFAQTEVGTFSITPKVGVNFANLTKVDDAKMRVGFAAGAEAGYQATEDLAITVGAIYSQQGAKLEGNGSTLTGKYDYLNIPVLANYYVAPGLAVKLGVQPSFLVSAKDKVEVGGNSAEKDVKDALNSFDLSIPVGVSYEISNVVIDARYNWGVTEYLKNNADGEKNSVFQITVGYKFAL